MAKIKVTEGQYAMLRIHEASDSFMGSYSSHQKEITNQLNNIWGTLTFITVAEVLKGEVSEDDLRGYKLKLSDMYTFISDLYKRGTQSVNKMSDDEYDAHGAKIESLLDDPYYSNGKKINALEVIVSSLEKLVSANGKHDIIKSFGDTQSKNV